MVITVVLVQMDRMLVVVEGLKGRQQKEPLGTQQLVVFVAGVVLHLVGGGEGD
jgi:hypothetical protein